MLRGVIFVIIIIIIIIIIIMFETWVIYFQAFKGCVKISYRVQNFVFRIQSS